MKRAGAVSLLVLVILGGLYLLNWLGVIAFTNMSGPAVASQVSAELSQQNGQPVTVTCPKDIPEKRGGIEDCQANAGHGTALVRIVQDDSRGHFHYTVQHTDYLSPRPSPAPADAFATACTKHGGSESQCTCIYESLLGQVIAGSLPADAISRATEHEDSVGGLPDDLAVYVDGCRTGA